MDYDAFIQSKAQIGGDHGFAPSFLPSYLFDFQSSLVEWAVRKGRSAIFADCGLGKTIMELVWAENVVRKTGGKVLLLTPLAVAHQIPAGDQLLQAVVTRLSRCTRETDTISRQGGDEFILLLNDVPDLETVERIVEEILANISEPMEINGLVLNTSCSLGVAIYPEDGNDFDRLLQKADTAMYNAKDAGRNAYRFFDEQMNQQAHEHLLLQNRLHQALFQNEFYLHYQPQTEIDSGRVVGVEALLRWHNAELGEVVPARFIPVAEDSGLIVPIGAWVLDEACKRSP